MFRKMKLLMKIKQIYLIGLLVQFSAVSSAIASQSPISDEAEAFKAGGYLSTDGKWHTECNDPAEPSFSPAVIESKSDLNGDGLPEVIISEGGTLCYGNTGSGFTIVSKQSNKTWKLILSGTGIPKFLKTKGIDGWPDIEIGGPGFCFLVKRWNGESYESNRYEYEVKSCKVK